jgi:hypothetical protein
MSNKTEKNSASIDARYRTMLILWSGQMGSVALFFLVTQFAEVADDLTPKNVLSFAFAAVGTFVAIISFVVKSKLLQRAEEKQDVALVQQALVVGCALSEVPALLGVVERFILPGREYLLLLAISLIAMALHFPRRLHLLAASYKDSAFGGSA